MKLVKDKKIIVLGVILFVFTIFYFVVANKISYAFENNTDLNSAYSSRLEVITTCAVAYGEANKDAFNEDGLLYITVQTLIDNNFLVADNDGIVENYLNDNESLNDKKIRIKNEDNKISAEVYS